NSVKHAGSGPDRQIDLGLSVLAERVRIEVRDQGRGFEPMPAAPHPEQESGWGLWLVEQLTDRWGVDNGPPTRVWCELDRHRPNPDAARFGFDPLIRALIRATRGEADQRRSVARAGPKTCV